MGVSRETLERIIDDLETKAEHAGIGGKGAAFQYAADELKKALQDG